MTMYQPMSMSIETERLRLRPWPEADARNYCALVAERDSGPLYCTGSNPGAAPGPTQRTPPGPTQRTPTETSTGH